MQLQLCWTDRDGVQQMVGWATRSEDGCAADLVAVLNHTWLDPSLVRLISEASQCISPFDKTHISDVQDQLEQIIATYIDKERDNAVDRAERGDFTPAEDIFGCPLPISVDYHDMDVLCAGVGTEPTEEGYGIVLTDPEAYGSAIADALYKSSKLALFDCGLELSIQNSQEIADAQVSELFAVLGLWILACSISIERKTHSLSVDNALQAAEAIHMGRMIALSHETYRDVIEKSREGQRRGGLKRQERIRKLKKYAIGLYTQKRYKNRSDAARKIMPRVQQYAEKSKLEKLSEERAWQTIYEWLSDYDKGNKSSK